MTDNSVPPELREATDQLTDWAKQPTLADLKQDLEDSRSNHDAQVQQISDVLDHMYLRGPAKLAKRAGRSSLQPRLIRKNAEWRYAALSEPFLSSPNIFEVQPVTWEDREAARQNGLLLNYQFNAKLDKQTIMDNLVRAAVDEGVCIVKVGWERETKMVEEEQFTYELVEDPTAAEALQRIAYLENESPSEFNEVDEGWLLAYAEFQQYGVVTSPVVVSSEMVEVEKTIKNQPTLEICDYRNVVIDPSCAGDLSKAQFIVHRFESSLSALKKDGRYSNLDHISTEGASPIGEPDYAPTSDATKNFQFTDKPRAKLVVHEYWGYRDIDGSGVVQPIVAAWVGNVLIRLELNPFPDQELPFITIPYLPVRNNVYGESDGALLIENQQVVGAVYRGLIDSFAKSAVGQTAFTKGMLDPANRAKLERGEDFEVNPGVDPRNGIIQMQLPQVPESASWMIQTMQNEAESMTGVKAFNSGIGGQALGNTATGVRGALDAASKRELGILRRLSAGMVKVGRKIISMNSVFLDDQEVVAVTNETFVAVRKDDLHGDFHLKLTISTAEEDNAKAEELAYMLQTLGNSVDWGISSIILSDIAELRKMPDLAKKIRDYQPQPDPMAQQKAQLELMLLQAQIATEQARAASFGAQANLNTQKIGTEDAKARSLNSSADRADLDFVQEETGVHQERQLEAIDRQIRGQERIAAQKNQQRQLEPSQMNKPGAY